MLNSITRLFRGKIVKSDEDIEDKYEIRDADERLKEALKDLEKYDYLEIYTYPTNYEKKRISKSDIKDLIKESKVQITYRPFPFLDYNYISNFSGGIEYCLLNHPIFGIYEGFRAYESGLFVWKGKILEIREHDKNVKPLQQIPYFLTLLFLFLRRYYEKIAPDDSLHIKIKLNSIENIALKDNITVHDPLGTYAKEPIIIEEDIRVIDIKADYDGQANIVNDKIFKLLHLYYKNDEILRAIQKSFK